MTNSSRLCLILCLLFVSAQVECGNMNPFSSIHETCKDSKVVDVILEFTAIKMQNFKPSKGVDFVQQLIDYIQKLVMEAQKQTIENIMKKAPGVSLSSLWITNRIGLRNLPCDLVIPIVNIPTTFEMREEYVMPMDGEPYPVAGTDAAPKVQWGLQQIRVQSIWPITRGEGVVVANIDTGVRGSHEALKDGWRGSDFSWLDGYTNSSDGEPYDDAGHGTHTMGTIVGRNGIGVAPGATWIACRGCNKTGCSEIALLTCGQWVMCPYMNIENDTIRNCSMRPRIVSNSWGGSSSTHFYNLVIDMWHKADIIPIFSAGNFGPKCSTVGSPGDQDNVISVGANDRDESMGSFSSRGPSKANKKTKPEVVAPGVNILSAWFTGDSNYTILNGTSMAGPHVAGVAVLMVAKNSNVTFTQVQNALVNTAFKAPMLVKKQTCSCLSIMDGFACPTMPANWPNNAYGAGRIDASQAFAAV